MGTLGARERERSCAHFGDKQPVEVPLAVAEPARQAGHAVAVHDAVCDEAHRTTNDVGTTVPLG